MGSLERALCMQCMNALILCVWPDHACLSLGHVSPTSSGTRRRHRTRARADIALAIFKVRRFGFQNEEFRRRIAMRRLKKAPLALDLSSLSWPTESNNMAREALGPVRCTPYRPTLLGRLISTDVLATNEMKHDYYLLCHGALKTGMLKCAHGSRTSERLWPSTLLAVKPNIQVL